MAYKRLYTHGQIPIEISTDAGMNAVLISANLGKCYKFTGTTGTYTNGDLYIVQGTASTSSFTVTDMSGTTTTYQFESGMTWGQWCDSAYNTDGYEVDTGYSVPNGIVNLSTMEYITTEPYGYEFVYDSNTITANHSYGTMGAY